MVNDHGIPEHSGIPTPPPLLKGYRTLLLSGATALVGVLAALDWSAVVPAPVVGLILGVLGLAGAVMRYLTNTPVTVAVPPVVAVTDVIKKHEDAIPPHVMEALKEAAPSAKL